MNKSGNYLIMLLISGIIAWVILFFVNLYLKPHDYVEKIVSTINTQDIDILYFGDSVLFSFDHTDDKEGQELYGKPIYKIYDILQHITDKKILAIDHGNYSAIVYRKYCKLLLNTQNKPQFVIIPINLRTFSEEWLPKPMNQFEKTQAMIGTNVNEDLVWCAKKYFSGRFLVNFRHNLWEKQQVPYLHPNKTNGELATYYNSAYTKNDKFPTLFSYHYLYQLNNDHVYFNYLKETFDVLKGKNIQIITYITPINMEDGKKFCGDLFTEVVSKNTKVIKQFIKEQNVQCLDLLSDLDASYFIDKEVVCEHVNFNGKRYIATSLKQFMKF